MAAHDLWGTVGQDVDPDCHNDQSHYLARQRQGGVGDRLTQPDTGNADRDQRVDRCDDGQNGEIRVPAGPQLSCPAQAGVICRSNAREGRRPLDARATRGMG